MYIETFIILFSMNKITERKSRRSKPMASRQEGQPMKENEIGKQVVDAAIAVHRELGPGLMETVYEVVLGHELKQRGLQIERQVRVPIEYRGIKFDEGFRADLILNDHVLIELKSVKKLTMAHRKQLQTYLRLTGLKLGFLLNFGEALMKNGIVRAVNGLEDP